GADHSAADGAAAAETNDAASSRASSAVGGSHAWSWLGAACSGTCCAEARRADRTAHDAAHAPHARGTWCAPDGSAAAHKRNDPHRAATGAARGSAIERSADAATAAPVDDDGDAVHASSAATSAAIGGGSCVVRGGDANRAGARRVRRDKFHADT